MFLNALVQLKILRCQLFRYSWEMKYSDFRLLEEKLDHKNRKNNINDTQILLFCCANSIKYYAQLVLLILPQRHPKKLGAQLGLLFHPTKAAVLDNSYCFGGQLCILLSIYQL